MSQKALLENNRSEIGIEIMICELLLVIFSSTVLMPDPTPHLLLVQEIETLSLSAKVLFRRNVVFQMSTDFKN